MSDRALRTVAVALALAILAVWVVLGVRMGVDLPWMDQWLGPLPQILHMKTGTLSFWDDLWRQQNESRKVVPTAISLALAAALGHYDAQIELAVGLVLCAAVAVALARLARACRMEPPAGAVLAVVYLALAGSIRTAHFHLFSITFERLLPELALVVSLALLTARGLTWGSALGSAALLVGAQYSHANAVVLWPLVAGFALVAIRRPLGPLLALVSVGALSSLAYFWSYAKPALHTPLTAIFAQPLKEWRHFFIRFLGNPLSEDTRIATIGAAIVLLVFAAACWPAWRRAPRAALAWITLGGYSIAEATMAMITRLPMSVGHAMRGDYVLHAVYLHVATAALLLLAWPARRRALAVVLVVAALAGPLSLVTPGALARFRETRDAKLAARACALEGTSCDATNRWQYPDPVRLHEMGVLARELGLWGGVR